MFVDKGATEEVKEVRELKYTDEKSRERTT